MRVTKRDGSLKNLDIDKIHAVLDWACNGGNDDALLPIKGVSLSEIEMKAHLNLHDKIKTADIHECLIKAAAELISKDTPNYDHVAARLRWFSVRKVAFSDNLPPHLYHIVKVNTKNGTYDPDVLKMYSKDEWYLINDMVDHNRDDLFRYAGAEQMAKKYLVQNRKNKKVFETFQIPYIMVAAILFNKYPKETRLGYVKRYYDQVSQHYVSLPTPIMAGLRTKVKSFSSCVLIDVDDSLDSITRAATAIVEYASRKAGIGLNIGRIRAQGQLVRSGDAITTGVLPFSKFFAAALKSTAQGSIRGASATFNFPLWHYEFDTLIELKNNKGTEETRLRVVDYCIHLNKTMYERLISGGVITFFSPNEVPDLYEAFYGDADTFKVLYEKYEQDKTKTKKQLPALEVFAKVVTERFETGRIYIMHADHMNTKTPFKEKVYMTNLCLRGDTLVDLLVDDINVSCYLKDVGLYLTSTANVLIKSCNDKLMSVYAKVTAFSKTNPVAKVIKVSYAGKYIVCTPEHLIYTDRGWVMAKDLMYFDILRTNTIESTNKLILTDLDDVADVYDITVEGTNCFFANNILVHNCVEIGLPTVPLTNNGGEIALCTLSAVNVGTVSLDNMPEACEMAVRGLDELLTYQEYPNEYAKRNVLNYRPLGVGIIGFAHWLAKNFYIWGKSSEKEVDTLMSTFSYNLIKTSIQLSKEKGSCLKSTKYHEGYMPSDTLEFKLLGEEAKKYGIRNAVLMALMPSECQSWKNKLNLSDGTCLDFHELLSNLNIDYTTIERLEIPTRLNITPFNIKTRYGDKEVSQVYYNGKVKTYKLTFEDGNTYAFTGNHLLRVIRDNLEQWVRVDNLQITDEVVTA